MKRFVATAALAGMVGLASVAVAGGASAQDDTVTMTIGLLQDMSSPNVTVGYLVPEFEVWNLQYASLTDKAADDFAPNVVGFVVEPSHIAKKNRLRRNTCAAAKSELHRDRTRFICIAQAHLIAGIDPVRILDLCVLRPEPRPTVRVAIITRRDVPERVAGTNGVQLGNDLSFDYVAAVFTAVRRFSAVSIGQQIEAVRRARRVVCRSRTRRQVSIDLVSGLRVARDDHLRRLLLRRDLNHCHLWRRCGRRRTGGGCVLADRVERGE